MYLIAYLITGRVNMGGVEDVGLRFSALIRTTGFRVWFGGGGKP